MKKRMTPRPLALLLGLFACSLIVAQDNKEKKPQTWQEKAAARFQDNPKPDAKKKISEALPTPTAKAKKTRRVLVFWRCEGFIHTSIPFGNHALKEIANHTDAFEADFADEYSVFTKENLAKYDGVIFNNTTNLVPDEAQQAALLDFVEGGKGVIGFHAASDNFKKWDDGAAMIGGIFNGHPWNAGGKWAFKLDDPDHKLNAAFQGKGFWHTDEIYWYRPENFQGREKLRVLMSLDMKKSANRKPLQNEKVKKNLKTAPESVDVPVSWIREIGKGRLFYTNLGHRDDTFWNPAILQHMLDGIQYALGDIEADATPSAELQQEPALAPEEEEK